MIHCRANDGTGHALCGDRRRPASMTVHAATCPECRVFGDMLCEGGMVNSMGHVDQRAWPFAPPPSPRSSCTHERPVFERGRLICTDCQRIIRIERIFGDRIFTLDAVYRTTSGGDLPAGQPRESWVMETQDRYR